MKITQNKLTFHEKPIISWVVGVFLFFVAGYIFFNNPKQWIGAVIVTVFAIIVLLISTSVAVTADKNDRVLIVSSRSLLTKSADEILFEDIATIQIGTSYDNEDGTKTYRIEVHQKDGKIVPLQGMYTGGLKKKQEKAQKLRDFIGIA